MAKTIDSVKTPLFAAVGAGDLAVEAVGGFVKDLRGRAATAATDTQARAQRTRELIASLPAQVPNDLTELRSRLNKDDLRKQAESYLHNAAETYGELAHRGETRVGELRKQHAVDARLSEAERLSEEAIEELTRRSRFVRDFATRVVGRIGARSEKATEAVSSAKNKAIAGVAEAHETVADRVADIADETRETLATAEVAAAKTAEKAVAAVKDALPEQKTAATDVGETKKEAASEDAEGKKPAESASVNGAASKKAPARRTATKRSGTTASRKKSPSEKSSTE